MNFRTILEEGKLFLESPLGSRLGRWTRRLFLAAVLIWILYQISVIGWESVWRSLPTQPLFYLLFVLMYFQLPFFDMIIYRMLWTFRILRSAPIFLLKRVYNTDLLGYSGELYLYMWGKRNLPIENRNVLLAIKDANIISSIASTLVAFGLLAIFLMTGQIRIFEWIMGQNETLFWGGLLMAILIAMLFIRFRRTVITMPLKKAYQIFGIQISRLLLLQIMNVLMYYVVIPDAPLWVWFTLISLEIILSRIPFIPNRDLIFVGMSIGLAEGFMVSRDEIAGLMVARAALGKLFNLAAFGIASMVKENSDVDFSDFRDDAEAPSADSSENDRSTHSMDNRSETE